MSAAKYSAERRLEILKLLEHGSYLSVAELARRFNVSRASIRRDLNGLCYLGMLERTYGGALKLQGATEGIPLEQREVSHPEEKSRIGKAAAALVNPGEIVFLDAGTTIPYLVPPLSAMSKLTVVTWNVAVITRLVAALNVEVICIGGFLDRSNVSFGGFLALSSLDAFGIRFDKFFLAASAISAKNGATEASLELIPIKRKAAELSREVIMVADSSKVGATVGGLVIAGSAIHRLITGQDAPRAEVEKLQRLGTIVDLV